MSGAILLSLLIVAAFAVPALVGRARAALHERHERMRRLVASKGWRLDAAAGGATLKLEGETAQVAWRVRTESDSHANVSTHWSSDDVACPDVVLAIRSRRAYDFLRTRFGRWTLRVARRTRSGDSSYLLGGLIENGVELPASLPDVRTRFVILARPGTPHAGAAPTAGLERALTNWLALPLLRAYQEALTVEVGGPNARASCSTRLKPEQLEVLIDVGVQAVRMVRARD